MSDTNTAEIHSGASGLRSGSLVVQCLRVIKSLDLPLAPALLSQQIADAKHKETPPMFSASWEPMYQG